jgi:transposase
VLVELSVMEQRYQAVLAVVQDGWKVTEIAERVGVSRQTIHAWIARYEQGGLAALADHSHRPSTCPHELSAEVQALICELRREHPGWGPRRVEHQLARRGLDPVPGRSSSTAKLPVTSSAWRMIASRLAAALESSRSVIGPPCLERTRCVHDVRQFQTPHQEKPRSEAV